MKQYFFILVLIFLLAGCGAKKNVAKQNEKISLQEQGVLVATSSEKDKPTLGLLWQNDHLQITLNQGRQLESYRAETDTLYLYETARDTADHSIRKYTLSIPTRELLIIKYNDSLVYPLMPTEEICEYPLDVKSIGQNPSKQYYGALTDKHIPLENAQGTYFACLKTKEGITIDSTKCMILFRDGTWRIYINQTLSNAGIIRKNPIKLYTIYNSEEKQLYLRDTTSITGHIHSLKEWTDLKKDGLPLAEGEYYHLEFWPASYGRTMYVLYPIKEDNDLTRILFLDYNDILIEEGLIPRGWKK